MSDSWQAIDRNSRGSLTAVSTADDKTIVRLTADPVTGALLVLTSGSGGTSLASETPAGLVNDSNTSFTVAHAPVFIAVNGGIYQAGQGIFTSYAGGIITLAAAVGTGGFITSYYTITGGSGTFSQFVLPATGTVNGSNVTFAFTSTPSYIVSDGVWYPPLDNNGVTQWSGTTTVTMVIPPQSIIFGIL